MYACIYVKLHFYPLVCVCVCFPVPGIKFVTLYLAGRHLCSTELNPWPCTTCFSPGYSLVLDPAKNKE